MDLDTSTLRAFVTVCDTRHFGQAAAELFLTQQALSKRVARLEDTLGVRLLQRDRRGVSLTAAGAQFLPRAQQIVDLTDSATDELAGTRSATIDVLDEHLSMLPVVRAVNARLADIDLSVAMRIDSATVTAALRAGSADLALGRPGPVGEPWPDDIRGVPLLAEPIELLVAPGHPLALPEVAMSELAGQQIWFPTSGAPAEWTELLDELVAAFDLRLDTRGSTYGFDYWLTLVAEGTAPPSLIGAAMVLPPGVAVVRVPIVQPVPVFWWWVMWRRRLNVQLAQRVVDQLTASVAVYPTPGRDNQREIWVPSRDRARRAD